MNRLTGYFQNSTLFARQVRDLFGRTRDSDGFLCYARRPFGQAEVNADGVRKTTDSNSFNNGHKRMFVTIHLFNMERER